MALTETEVRIGGPPFLYAATPEADLKQLAGHAAGDFAQALSSVREIAGRSRDVADDEANPVALELREANGLTPVDVGGVVAGLIQYANDRTTVPEFDTGCTEIDKGLYVGLGKLMVQTAEDDSRIPILAAACYICSFSRNGN